MGNRLVKKDDQIDGASIKSYDPRKIDAVLERSLCLRLSMVGDGKPYIFLMSFTYDGENVYIHTDNKDKPLDELQKKKIHLITMHQDQKSEVCLEFDIIGPTVPPDQNAEEVKKAQGCYWDLSYAFVIGRGMIEEVKSRDEKFRALEQRVKRYTGKEYPIPDDEFNCVTIWRIKLDKEKTFAAYRFIDTPK